jgi:hypothetical protein
MTRKRKEWEEHKKEFPFRRGSEKEKHQKGKPSKRNEKKLPAGILSGRGGQKKKECPT